MNKDSNTPHILNHKSYALGFIISLILTLGTFYLSTKGIFSPWVTFVVISIFAIEQFIIQVLLFLHVGQESKPKLNTAIFLYTVMTVVILVFGSIWIMYNLDYNHGGHRQEVSEEQIQKIIENE